MGKTVLCLLVVLCLGLARAQYKTLKLAGFQAGGSVLVKGKYFPNANLNSRFMDFSLIDQNSRQILHLIFSRNHLGASYQSVHGAWTWNTKTSAGYMPSGGDEFKLRVWFATFGGHKWDVWVNDGKVFDVTHAREPAEVAFMRMNMGASGEVTEMIYYPPACTWVPGRLEAGAVNNRPDTYRALLLKAKWANDTFLNTINDNEERELIIQRLVDLTANTEAELNETTPCGLLEAAIMYVIIRDIKWMNQTELAATKAWDHREKLIEKLFDYNTKSLTEGQFRSRTTTKLIDDALTLQIDAIKVEKVISLTWNISSASVTKGNPEVVAEQLFTNCLGKHELKSEFKVEKTVTKETSEESLEETNWDMSATEGTSVTVEKIETHTASASATVGISATAEADVGVASASTTASAEATVGYEYTNSASQSNTVERSTTVSRGGVRQKVLGQTDTVSETYSYTQQVTVPAYSATKRMASIIVDKVDIIYVMKVKTKLGEIKEIRGKWKGAAFTQIFEYQQSLKCDFDPRSGLPIVKSTDGALTADSTAKAWDKTQPPVGLRSCQALNNSVDSLPIEGFAKGLRLVYNFTIDDATNARKMQIDLQASKSSSEFFLNLNLEPSGSLDAYTAFGTWTLRGTKSLGVSAGTTFILAIENLGADKGFEVKVNGEVAMLSPHARSAGLIRSIYWGKNKRVTLNSGSFCQPPTAS